MLDLKSKLAAAGLVTQKDIDRVEKPKSGKRKKNRGGRSPAGKASGDRKGLRLPVSSLQGKPKGEQYEAVRRWVERTRLDDPARAPSDEAKTFHFPKASGQVGRLVLEPDVHRWVQEGGAGIIAYMSNHGLAHAAVPADDARHLAKLFPLWLRVLKGHPEAGQLESETE